MIEVQLPKLDKFLEKDVSVENPLRRGVIVLNDKAIAISNTAVLIVDLFELFLKDEENAIIESETRELFDFMNGNIIPGEVWSDLTKKSLVEISDDNIVIHGANYSKVYELEPINYDKIALLNVLNNFTKIKTPSEHYRYMPYSFIDKLNASVKDIIKGDYITFENIGQNSSITRFRMVEKPVFGFVINVEGLGFNEEENILNSL